MIEELISMEGPATKQDLSFLAGLCILALQDLGHINRSEFKEWHIDFGDVYEQKGLLGATSQTEEGKLLILISPQVTKSKLLATVAHEAVHLIQFMKQDTERVGPDKIKWKGKEYQILPGADPEYDNQPWEEEAYRLAPHIIGTLKTVPKDQIEKVRKSFYT